MGIKFGKFEPVMGDHYPTYPVNAHYVGGCYLYVHDQNESIEEHKHHSFFVDVAGESSFNTMGEIDQLCGLMLHVTANSAGKTEYCHGKAMVRGKKDSIYFVGRLTNTQYRSSRQWASHFQNIGDEIYLDLVENNNGKEEWTSKLNCQVFVKKMMEHLNLDYPPNVLTSSDIPPTLVDLSILSLRLSTRS